jgi:hypothetical protein
MADPTPIYPGNWDHLNQFLSVSHNEDGTLSAEASGGATTLTDLTDVTGTAGLNKSPVDDGSGVFPLTEVTTRADLDAVLASVAAVNWVDLELQNGFSTWAGEPDLDGIVWAPARYRLTLNNVVHLEGVVIHDTLLSDADAPLVIAQLPPECSPGMALWFDCPTHVQYLARVDVHGDGTLVFRGVFGATGDIQYMSLSGINFSVGA